MVSLVKYYISVIVMMIYHEYCKFLLSLFYNFL